MIEPLRVKMSPKSTVLYVNLQLIDAIYVCRFGEPGQLPNSGKHLGFSSRPRLRYLLENDKI